MDEIKRDLINFENEKCNERNTENPESVLVANDRTCFNCHKMGHNSKFCLAKQQEPHGEKSKPKLTRFKCKSLGRLPIGVSLTKNLNPMI